MNFIETLRLDDNVVQNIAYHTTRMSLNSEATLPPLELLNTHKSGRVKCRVVYNETAILSITFTPYTLPTINSLKIVESSDVVYDKKYLDRGVLNELFSKRGECDDVLICKRGLITDSSFCNVVFKRGERLYTPNTPLLAGTKRSHLIDNGTITPCTITCKEVFSYECIYLINAMIELSDNICVPTSKIFG